MSVLLLLKVVIISSEDSPIFHWTLTVWKGILEGRKLNLNYIYIFNKAPSLFNFVMRDVLYTSFGYSYICIYMCIYNNNSHQYSLH